MKRLILLLFTFLIPAFSQDISSQYVASRESSLSSSTEKITVQQPTSGAKIVVFDYAKVYCSVACVATLSVAGTAATTTSLTPTALNRSVASTAVAFRSSNAGSGTTIDTYRVAAGGEFTIDLSKFYLDNDGTAQNLSIATDSITGTARISIKWTEK